MQSSQVGFDFEGFAGSMPDAVVLADSNDRITYVNEMAAAMFEYSAGELLGEELTMLMPERYRETHRSGLARMNRSEVPRSIGPTLALHGRRKDGTEFPIELLLSSWQTSLGRIFSVIIRDTTQQRQAAQTLRESQERFNSFMSHAPLVAFIKDAHSRYVWINDELERRFGLHLADIQGKTDLEIFDRESAEQNLANDRQVLEGGRAIDSSSIMTTADGVERAWLMFKFPLQLSSGERQLGGFAIDVTERNALEKKLEQAERISSLGRVAASLAHEVNNVLMGILPFAEVIKKRGKDDKSLQSAAEHISRSVERGKRITQEILVFTRATDPVLRPFDCRNWLEESAPELRLLLGDGIDIRIAPPDANVFIRGDALQLLQVLTNLTMNARDAMQGQGTLTISARQCCPGDGLPFMVLSHPEQFVHLSVVDTGTGIPATIIGRIFEPLFTTKRNAGTGLGLAITHQIIARHGGEIHVESVEGKGTTFHLLLPIAPRPYEPKLPPRAHTTAPFRRVVLVEDELSVGEGLVALLEADAVAVRWVRTGAEAAPAIVAFQPDLLLLDVGLPDMNGFDLYRRLRGRFPNLPTIFSTGHGDKSLVEALGDAPVAHILKPYDYDALLNVMDLVLTR